MNTSPGPLRLQARYAFPVAGLPVENALVTIVGERIVEVRAISSHSDTCGAIDLGNAAIIPGLVNAHTHLEFSHFAAPLGRSGQIFPEWIREVVAWRRSGPAAPSERPAITGLRESAAAGTTTLGEIATAGWSPEDFEVPRVDATVFSELMGLDPTRIEPNQAAAQEHLARGRSQRGARRWQAGLSPHAPYTVHPELFARVVKLSATARIPLAFHLAESREELELLRARTGPFVNLLEDLGVWYPTAIPLASRPLDYLRQLVHAHRALVIHGNYLADDEIALLAEHADRLALVYCSRTHAYFRHERYPLEKLLAAGVTLALGTDSRASNPDLSLWKEMQFVAANYANVPPATILELGTLGGAKALGLDHGTLTAGKRADLAILGLPATSTTDPHDLLFTEESQVIATLYRGNITADQANLLSAARAEADS